MRLTGPTEENPYFQSDAGFSNETMAELVAAYQESMATLEVEVVKKGGFTWQMMRNGPGVRNTSAHGRRPAGELSQCISCAACCVTVDLDTGPVTHIADAVPNPNPFDPHYS